MCVLHIQILILIVKKKMNHPKTDLDHLQLPRRDGGSIMIQTEFTYKTITLGFETYLDLINDQMLKLVYQEKSTKNIFNN